MTARLFFRDGRILLMAIPHADREIRLPQLTGVAALRYGDTSEVPETTICFRRVVIVDHDGCVWPNEAPAIGPNSTVTYFEMETP